MRNASATGMPSSSRSRTTFSLDDLLLGEPDDLLGDATRDDRDAVVVADDHVAGVHGHAGALDGHAHGSTSMRPSESYASAPATNVG